MAQEIKPEWAEIGLRLKEAREYLGLSQQFAADHLGLHRPSITVIEQGKREVSALEMKQFSRLYRRPLEWLITGENPENVRFELPAAFAERLVGLSQNDRDAIINFGIFLAGAGTAPRPLER